MAAGTVFLEQWCQPFQREYTRFFSGFGAMTEHGQERVGVEVSVAVGTGAGPAAAIPAQARGDDRGRPVDLSRPEGGGLEVRQGLRNRAHPNAGGRSDGGGAAWR